MEILVPYFRIGLEDGEFCMWVTSEPLTNAAVKKAMKNAMPDFDDYLNKGQIEILSHNEWYVKKGVFNTERVLKGWSTKYALAVAGGYKGLRAAVNASWIEKDDWRHFMAYEEALNKVIGNYRMLAVCTYLIDNCSAAEVIDVAGTHQFALVNRGKEWNVIANNASYQAKEEMEYLASFPRMNSNPIIELDSRGRIIFNNEAATRNLENIGVEKDMRLLVPGNIKEILKQLKNKKGSSVLYHEVKIEGKTFGENIHLLRNPETVRIYAHDITKLKQTEEALRKSEERLRLAQANAGVGVWEWNQQKRSLSFEPELESIYGLPHGTVRRYRDWQERVHPGDIARIEAERDDALAKQQPFNLEFRAFHGSGEVRWMAAMGKASYNETGKIVRILGINMDITERKYAEEAFREGEERMKRAEEMAHLGSWELDLINNRLSWSDEAYRILGLQPHEFNPTYEAFLEAVHPDDRAAVDAAYFRSLSEERNNYEIEHRIVRKSDGEIRIIYEKCEHIRDSSGRALRSIGLIHDITKQKKSEKFLEERTKQLEETNKELESFSYSISHDLRAPLRAVDGYARMILKRVGDNFDEDTLKKFNVIRNSAQMMGKLIDDLLAFSQLGRKSITTSSLNINELVANTWEELQVTVAGRNKTFSLQNNPSCWGDKTLVKQVYINLLSNALKFTNYKDAAYIEAGGYENDKENVYYVKDNGAGFDMKYYDKLFGVFQRLHSQDEYEGTGVGLAIVQRIVRRHGGRVWAEGKENKGATFYFTLPKESK